MIFNINLPKLPSQYGEVSVMHTFLNTCKQQSRRSACTVGQLAMINFIYCQIFKGIRSQRIYFISEERDLRDKHFATNLVDMAICIFLNV